MWSISYFTNSKLLQAVCHAAINLWLSGYPSGNPIIIQCWKHDCHVFQVLFWVFKWTHFVKQITLQHSSRTAVAVLSVNTVKSPGFLNVTPHQPSYNLYPASLHLWADADREKWPLAEAVPFIMRQLRGTTDQTEALQQPPDFWEEQSTN